jgi:hypothetical protein
MEGNEIFLLTDDGLDDDLMLSYMLKQLRHHEVAQALLTNPPPKGARSGPGLIGAGMSCSMLMPSTVSDSKLEHKLAPTYRLHRWSTLLHLSSWTPVSQHPHRHPEVNP